MCARALKQEYNMNFLAAKGPQLLLKYVGETEEAIRKLFKSAQELAPCILFFDEVDALGRKSISLNSPRTLHWLLTRARIWQRRGKRSAGESTEHTPQRNGWHRRYTYAYL